MLRRQKRKAEISPGEVLGRARSSAAILLKRRRVERFDRWFRDLSVRHKLTVLITTVTSAALLLLGAAMVLFDVAELNQSLENELRTNAALTGYHCAAALLGNRPGEAAEALAMQSVNARIVSACIYTRGGAIFARYFRGRVVEDLPDTPPLDQTIGVAEGFQTIFSPIEFQGERLGTVYLKSEMSGIRSRMWGYALAVAIVMALCVGVALLLSSRLQRTISDPIAELTALAKTVAEKRDYSLRIDKQRNDEFGVLMDEFNGMLAQIQERDDALRKHHLLLEERVEARTMELQEEVLRRKRAQEELQQEIRERQATEEERHRAKEAVEAAVEDGEEAVFDVEAALWVTDNRVDMLRRLLDVFLSSIPGRIEELGKALEAGDQEETHRLAHSVKGAGASVGAKRFAQRAARLEALAKAGDLEPGAALVGQLRAKFAELRQVLDVFDWKDDAPADSPQSS